MADKEICIYCKSEPVYCKHYCKCCYSRVRRNGMPEPLIIQKKALKPIKEPYRNKAINAMHPISSRGREMFKLYKEGKSVREIGALYHISGARVHQILHGEESHKKFLFNSEG